MSNLDFPFIVIPRYFLEHEWFKPRKGGGHLKCLMFVWWCFGRCSCKKRTVFHDHKEIELEPFEFIFGRSICSEQTGLTDKEIRGQQFQLIEAKKLEKVASKTTSKFSVYRWLTESFCENEGQQKGQQGASKGPAKGHNQEEKRKKKKEQEESAYAPHTPKIFYRERVDLTEEEHGKLLDLYGAEQLEWMLDKLSNYLCRKKKTQDSCYLCLCKGGWVLEAYEKHMQSSAAKSKVQPIQADISGVPINLLDSEEFLNSQM